WPKQMTGELVMGRRRSDGSVEIQDRLHGQGDENGQDTAHQVKPEVANFEGRKIEPEHQDFGTNSSDECGGTADIFEKKGDEEQSENGPVEQRADDVDRLDEVFEQGEGHGKSNGDEAPAERKNPGGPDVMTIAA